MVGVGSSGDGEPLAVDGRRPRSSFWRRSRWWAGFLIWILTCVLLPFAVGYFFMAVGQSKGAAPGNTEFKGVATVSDCVRNGRQFGLTYRCTAVPHLVPDTAATRSQIETNDLIAPHPVTGDVEVVERCEAVARGGLSGCDFYAVDQIRSVSWYWLTVLPMPVTVLVSILWIFTRRARRDGSLRPRARPAPVGPSAAERFGERYGVQVPPTGPDTNVTDHPTGQPPESPTAYDGGPYR